MQKPNTYLAITGILLLATVCMKLHAQQPKLVRQDNHISLYESWIRNARAETVRELTAVFTVKAGKSEIIALLCDPAKGTTWNNNACRYTVLSLDPQKKWITYIRYRIPWPFDDQDCCLLYQVQNGLTNDNATVVLFESTEHKNFPQLKNVVPIKGVRGRWELKRQKDNTTSISYTVSTFRSAHLPRWISDPIVHDNLLKTMLTFKQILEQ